VEHREIHLAGDNLAGNDRTTPGGAGDEFLGERLQHGQIPR
jgi:hypothetical protein